MKEVIELAKEKAIGVKRQKVDFRALLYISLLVLM